MSNETRLLRARERLAAIAQDIEGDYKGGRRVLSFDEYLDLFAESPVRQGRDASRYVRDAFDHYGTRTVDRPWGPMRRFNLFDLAFEADTTLRRDALVGHEGMQGEIYRVLSNFAREGRPNRFLLLHGPNGSAKSTIVSCIFRALEHYSTLAEGALYRFHWVFPSQKTVRGAIGFGGEEQAAQRSVPGASYAHLDETQIDARLHVEVRDHPLFLLPLAERRQLVRDLYKDAGATEPPAEWLLSGQLAQKNQLVLEALLTTYKGNLREALRHVQVERYFISHRYRTGAATIGPQMAVDAGERQVTADRSLAALPTTLQAVTLFEAFGELVEAQGGVLEYSDLLKRPIDAFKYLQLVVETGEVPLGQQSMQLNSVMLGSANEVHLDAFREHHEYPSFRGRFEMIRAPYLLSWKDEQAIYEAQIVPQITRPVAPHATRVAAMFAVLSRMRHPSPERYPAEIGPMVASLSAIEKMDLYGDGKVPDRLDADAQKTLRAHIHDVYAESDVYPIYEGRIGASPREMRGVLLNASQSPLYEYLSPLAVLDELEQLSTRKGEFAWLQEKPLPGGYHDPKAMLEAIRSRLYDTWEEELRFATGLVDEGVYADLFDRYVTHASVWSKGEKVRNKHTGDYEEPDVSMMKEVEKLLGVPNGDEFRRGLISSIAAWAIDHPGQRVVPTDVFPQHVRKMRQTVFAERRQAVALLARDLVMQLRDGAAARLDPARAKQVEGVLARLIERYGYQIESARDAASALVRWRFQDLIT